MNSFRPDKKLVRVPAALKREIDSLIYKSRTVLAECPFGHDVKVTIEVEYVPKRGPELYLDVQIRRKKVPLGTKLIQSDEPMTDEHFEALLRAPLKQVSKRFIRLFHDSSNEPMSPTQWKRAGFPYMTHMREINSLCRRHCLGISFAETGEYDLGEASAEMRMRYKFYVLERANKTRG